MFVAKPDPSKRLPSDRSPRYPRGILWLVALALVLVALVVGALVALPMLKSPAQVAADAAPPSAKAVTAVVEKRALTAQVVMRGVVAPGPSFSLKPSPALVEKAPVVTAMPLSRGSKFRVGAVILETNGEPLIAVDWPFPAYRDILPGFVGPDVAQLQRTLAGLGYESGTTSTFDAQTQSGLIRFYRDLGYEAPTASTSLESSEGTPTQGEKGVHLPARNVVQVPKAENTLTDLAVGIGTRIGSADLALMSLDGEANIVVASTSPERAATIEAGDTAELTGVDGSQTFPMVVQAVAKASAEIPGLGAGVRVDLKFANESSIAALSPPGSSQKVVIATGGNSDAVLVVPITAVYSNADGSSYVTLASQPDDPIDVGVGLNVDGWVSISPKNPDELHDGDRVIVGESLG